MSETGVFISYKIRSDVGFIGHGRVCPTECNLYYIEYSVGEPV